MKHILLIAIPAIGTTILSCTQNKEPSQEDGYSGASIKQPVSVEAVTVTRGILSGTIRASGIVYGASEATVVSESRGTITSVSFGLGDKVREKQTLVGIDDRIAKLARETAKQELESAERNLAVIRKLGADSAASPAEVERAQAAALGAKTAYERARKAYEDCTIRAPIKGYIASKDRAISRGNYLTDGVAVARIVDLDVLQTELWVSEREVGRIAEGDSARVSIESDCSSKEWDASIKAIAAGADERSGSFKVIIEWKNTCDRALRSGMTVSVTIPGQGTEEAVMVPTAALVIREGLDVVLTARGDRVMVVPVRKGRVAGNRTQILEGVSVGDIVIMSALGTLAPNNPVTVTLVGESGDWQ